MDETEGGGNLVLSINLLRYQNTFKYTGNQEEQEDKINEIKELYMEIDQRLKDH